MVDRIRKALRVVNRTIFLKSKSLPLIMVFRRKFLYEG